MKPTVYALGHSTTPIEKFLLTLCSHEIATLVDIRTVPRSRRNPQFDGETLSAALHDEGIAYIHIKELGGLRRPDKGSSLNGGWRNDSFRGFADHMQTPGFEESLDRLIGLARRGRVAMMCAEGNPSRCHRSLVADALEARGIPVVHISGRSAGRRHRTTPFAKVVGTKVTYPSGAPAAPPT